MNRLIKKSFSVILALVVLLSAFSALALASDYDYSKETLSFKTEFYTKNGSGDWVKAESVNPGESVKARLSIGTTYYTSSIQMIAFYNEAFFTETYTENSLVSGAVNTSPTSSAVTEDISVSVNRLSDTHRILAGSKSWDGLVPEGYITQDYVDTHNAFVISGSFNDGKSHLLSDSEWLVEFDLTVKEDAEGFGVFEIVETTVQSPERQSSYANIPVSENGADGTSVTATPLYASPISISINNGKLLLTSEETTTQQVTMPTTTEPESTTQQVTVPTTTEPESTTQQVTVPTTTEPESTTQQVTVPTTTEPESTTQQVTVPTTTKPETTVPQTTTPATTKPAVTEPETTRPSVSKPDDENTTESSFDSSKFEIKQPSKSSINCADGIVLHLSLSEPLPSGYSVKWSADNSHFDLNPDADKNTCTIISSSNGNTVITATVLNENNEEVASDSVEIKSNAGFFQKIIAFFKKLFGLTKIYEK